MRVLAVLLVLGCANPAEPECVVARQGIEIEEWSQVDDRCVVMP